MTNESSVERNHVDADHFWITASEIRRRADSINRWIGDSEDRLWAVISAVATAWKLKMESYMEFEQKAFELAALLGPDIRSFVRQMPYTPCTLTEIILSVLHTLLNEPEIVSLCSSSGKENPSASAMEPPTIPEWVCAAVKSMYDPDSPEIRHEYERMRKYYIGAPDEQRRLCPVCMMLDTSI